MVSDSEGGLGRSRFEELQSHAALLCRRAFSEHPFAAEARDRLERLRIWLVTLLKPLVRNPVFERLVTVLILVNAATLGMETSATLRANFGVLLTVVDHLILAVFVFELAARMLVFGTRFWRDPWSIFDFLVVAVTFLPASDNISVLRALRIVRALRLVSAIPAMRRVVNGLLIAIPGMSSIVVLLLLIFYVFSVMATNMFADTLPERFGTIGDSLLTLFQVMSLDGWTSEVARPVMAVHPWSWIFFLIFILITSFTVLNLFIGIIVDGMQQQHIETKESGDLVQASRFGMLKTQFSVSLPKGPDAKGGLLKPDASGLAVGSLAVRQASATVSLPAELLAGTGPAITPASGIPELTSERLDRLLDEVKALCAEVRALRQAQDDSGTAS